MVDPQLVPIYDVLDAPLTGMNSARYPLALPQGSWPLLQNVRLDDGTLMARNPTVAIATGGLPTSQPFGVFSGFVDNIQVYLAAMAVTGGIAIYESLDSVNWLEATAISGAYGNTRLTSGLQVNFKAVRDKVNSVDTVIIQNGTDSPRVYTRAAINGAKIRSHAPVTYPQWALTTRPIPQFANNFFSVANNTAKGIVNTNSLAISAMSGAISPITVTTLTNHGLANGDFVSVTGSTGNTVANGTWQVTVTGATTFTIQDIQTNAAQTGNGVYGGSGTVFLQVFAANGNNNVVQFALNKTAINVSSVVDVGFTTIDITGSAQMIIAADSATLDIWSNLLLAIKTTAIAYIYPTLIARIPWTDPGFANSPYTGGWQGEELLIYSLGDIDPATRISVNKLSAFWQGQLPTASVIANIHAIFFSGTINQGSSFSVAYRNSGTKAQGPGAIMPVKVDYTGNTIVSVAGTTSTVAATIPYLPYVRYNYLVPIQGPSVADLALGIDTVDLYRRDVGSTNYYLIKSISFGSWNDGAFPNAWCYKGPQLSPSVPATVGTALPPNMNNGRYLNTNTDTFDYSQLAPDDLYTTIPTGFAMTVANNRFVVGSGTNGVYPNVQTSEGNNPFRFRQLSDVSAANSYRSPSFFTLQGENIQAFATVASSGLGTSIIYVFTQKAIYVMGGFDSISLTNATLRYQMGTLSPSSVVQRKGYIYWLNEEGQVCRLDNVTPSYLMATPVFIGRKVIDDRTRAISASRLANVRGLAVYERYYLFYTPSGSVSNTRALVWDEVTEGWVEDTLPTDGEHIYSNGSSPNRNFAISQVGQVYEHEQRGNVTPQAITLTTSQLRVKPFSTQIFNRIAINADPSPGSILTISRQYYKTAQVETTTLTLTALGSENRILRYDNYLGNPAGKTDQVISITISGSALPGTRFYAIGMETLPRESAIDVDMITTPTPPSSAFYGLDFSDSVDTIYLVEVL